MLVFLTVYHYITLLKIKHISINTENIKLWRLQLKKI